MSRINLQKLIKNITSRLRNGVKAPYQRPAKKIPPMMKGTGKKQNSDISKNFRSERPPLLKNRNSAREPASNYKSFQANHNQGE